MKNESQCCRDIWERWPWPPRGLALCHCCLRHAIAIGYAIFKSAYHRDVTAGYSQQVCLKIVHLIQIVKTNKKLK